MAERLGKDADGHLWTADRFAATYGYRYDESHFATIMRTIFEVDDYERMTELWGLRDWSGSRNRSGTFPEGADIGDYL